MPRCHFSSVPSLKNKIKSQNPFVAFLSLSLSLSPSFFSCLCHSLSLSLSSTSKSHSYIISFFLSINLHLLDSLSLLERESALHPDSHHFLLSPLRFGSLPHAPDPNRLTPIRFLRSDPIRSILIGAVPRVLSVHKPVIIRVSLMKFNTVLTYFLNLLLFCF